MIRAVGRLDGHHDAVLQLAFDPARQLLFSADAKGFVRASRPVQSANGGEVVWRAKEPAAVTALACATRGTTDVLMAAGAFDRLSMYARANGEERTHLVLAGDVPGRRVVDLAVAPSLGRAVAVTQQGVLIAYQLADGARLLAQPCGLDSAKSCAVRAEGEAGAALVAVGDSTGRVALLQYTAVGMTILSTQTLAADTVVYGTTLLDATAATGPALLALTSDGTLHYQGASDDAPRPIAQTKQEHYALAVRADGRMALVGGEPKEIGVIRLPDGKRLATLATDGRPIWSLAVDAEGRYAAAGDSDGTIFLYHLAAALP